MAGGQAVGTAAALSIQKGITPYQLISKSHELQEKLIEQGVNLEPRATKQ
jgi:hypothetical protein